MQLITKGKRLIVQTVHDVTGNILEVTVKNGDVSSAIQTLKNLLEFEDYLAEFIEPYKDIYFRSYI